MKQQRYRQAVQSIRWTPQQRTAIEEKLLAVPQPSVDPDEWIDGLEDPAAAYRQSREALRKSEEYNMKAKQIRKIMWIGLAAAILATGGTVAAIGYAKKHPHTLEITWKNGTVLNLTSEEVRVPYFPSRYANPASGSLSFLAPTENGWYFRKLVTLDGTRNEWGGRLSVGMLCYADKETGQTVPVCSRPNCLHDGNEYCAATTDRYAASYMQYYNGYLYTMTNKFLDPENRWQHGEYISQDNDSADNCRQVLLRYAPDGTEITELAEFGTGQGAAACVINRGYVWCLVQIQQAGEEIENPITHNIAKFTSGGWQIWGYELATGKSVLLYDATGDLSINHVNNAPDDIYAFGDYLYFVRRRDDWSGGQGLARLSLLTGDVTDGKEQTIIKGDHVTCLSATHAIRNREITQVGERFLEYYTVDLATGEEKKISPDWDTVPADQEVLGRDFMIRFMNDRYIFAVDSDTYNGKTKIKPARIAIYDYDGNLVRIADTGYRNYWEETKKKESSDGNNQIQYYAETFYPELIDGDTIYATHQIGGDDEMLQKHGREKTYDYLYTTVDELLSGNPEWKKAYSAKEEVRGNAE